MTSNIGVTVSALRSDIIEALAKRLDKSPAALEAELAVDGHELPIDSIFIAEILTDIEAKYDIDIAADAAAARSMRSVLTFAEAVHHIITEGS